MKRIKNNKGFTLIELLVVVLIIGILAAIALPKYQLATDKARYSKMMDFTKAIADAEVRALMLTSDPTFNDLDIDIPANCTLTNSKTITCDNGNWFCHLHNYSFVIFPRCTDFKINASYYYSIDENTTKRICYAHSKDKNDRQNRLCQAMTGHTNSFDDSIAILQPNGTFTSKSSYGYYF